MRTETSISGPPTLLDLKAVAALLNCSPCHVYRMSDAGRMPAPVRVGFLVRWNRAVIENWIAQGCPLVRTVKAARQ